MTLVKLAFATQLALLIAASGCSDESDCSKQRGGIKSITATPGDGAIEVTWETDAAPPLTGFHVEAVVAPGQLTPSAEYGLTADKRRLSLTGLTNGTLYNVAVFGYCYQTPVAQQFAQATPTAPPSPRVYVAAKPMSGTGSGTILQYGIGADGTLSPLSTASVAAGADTWDVVVGPKTASGRFAYAINTDGSQLTPAPTVSQYSVTSNGELMPLSPGTVATGISPGRAAIVAVGSPSPSHYLYVPNDLDKTVSRYAIAPTTGQLTAKVVAAAGTAHSVCAIGSNLYVANSGPTEGISQYAINSDGTLAALTPAMVGNSGQLGIGCHPGGTSVYASGIVGNVGVVLQYSVGAGGVLTPMTPATVATSSTAPSVVAVDPLGKYVFVTDPIDNTVSQFTIGASGALTAMSPATVTPGGSPSGAAFDPSGKYFYVTNSGDGAIAQFAVGATGLTPLAPAKVMTAALSPQSIATAAP